MLCDYVFIPRRLPSSSEQARQGAKRLHAGTGAMPAQWLHEPAMKKPRYQFDSGVSLPRGRFVVGSERFELSTYGLRVRCSTS